MKKTLMIVLLLLMAFGARAQGPEGKGFDPRRFDQEKEQFITVEAGLTPAEAASFFPLYREMQRKQRLYFAKMQSYSLTNPNDDKASLKAIKEMDAADLAMKKLQQEYHLKFCKVLSPGKVLKVIRADERFHREAFKRMAARRHSRECKPHGR